MTETPDIPDEAVEAVAIAIHSESDSARVGFKWDGLDAYDRGYYLAAAAELLREIWPFIEAQVAERVAPIALREAANEFAVAYERLTAKSGAYGSMKIRAAYRLASQLLAEKADSLARRSETETPE